MAALMDDEAQESSGQSGGQQEEPVEQAPVETGPEPGDPGSIGTIGTQKGLPPSKAETRVIAPSDAAPGAPAPEPGDPGAIGTDTVIGEEPGDPGAIRTIELNEGGKDD